MDADTRKKLDNRIRILIENNVQKNHRSLIVVVSEKSKHQVPIFHHMLSKAVTGRKPSVLWCYKKELGFSTHQKKRMKMLQKKKQFGGKINEDNPFESFISSTQISYCYYKDSERIRGNTFGMLVLQDFEALTPNLLARTIETVEGGGLIVLLLHTIDSLKQLYTLSMDVHNRYRTEGNQDITPRFNERFLLSLSSCPSSMVVDDRLNILPISSHLSDLTALPKPEDINELTLEQQQLLDKKNSLQDVQPLGAIVNLCKTVDQLDALNEFVKVLQDKVSKATVSLTAARGRGKSATLGLSIAAAIANGYSSVYLTSPSPENLKTLFEFVLKGFEAVNLKQHNDYEIIYLKDETNGKLISRINIYRDHRQTIQYIHPSEINNGNRCNAELVVIDEAAAIPLPLIKSFFGPYLTFLASTINGYEGTGRSLSFKLLKQLKTQDLSVSTNDGFMNQIGKKFVEISMNESIRYSPGDEIEQWLYHLLCLDANTIDQVTITNYPMPDDCELYYINRDTLFSYHSVSEQFLQNLVSLYTSSHYKNSPNDLQMISDAPAHHLFCLLSPIDDAKLKRKDLINGKLPEVLVFIQVALEGKISEETILNNLQRGKRGSGDLIPWTLSQQFQDDSFASLSGARIVRIATHPKCANKGYGTRALHLLQQYYKGFFDKLDFNEIEKEDVNEEVNVNLNEEQDVEGDMNDIKKKSKKSLPPLLNKLSERQAERLNYLGTSFGLTNELLKFWKKNGYIPVYIRQTTNDLTGEHSCIMVKSIEEECDWINEFFYDFRKQFVNLLAYQFRNFKIPLPLNILQNSNVNLVEQLKAVTKTQQSSVKVTIGKIEKPTGTYQRMNETQEPNLNREPRVNDPMIRKKLSGAAKRKRAKARAAAGYTQADSTKGASPGESNGGKRIRSPGDAESTPPAKRPPRTDQYVPEQMPEINHQDQGQANPSFAEAVGESLTYVIVGTKKQVLDSRQVSSIMGNIVWELEKFIDTQTTAPSFRGKRLGESELELRCADARTEDWLKWVFPRLKPWSNAALTLLKKSDWEAMEMQRKMVRMSVVVPWHKTGSYFLDILRSNDPRLRTRCWEIKYVENRDNSTMIFLKVDELSAEALRQRNFKAFWLLDEITFTPKRGSWAKGISENDGQKAKRGEEPTTNSKDADQEGQGMKTKTGTSATLTNSMEGNSNAVSGNPNTDPPTTKDGTTSGASTIDPQINSGTAGQPKISGEVIQQNTGSTPMEQ